MYYLLHYSCKTFVYLNQNKDILKQATHNDDNRNNKKYQHQHQ